MISGDRPVMVVHGPEPFDRGDVGRLLDALGPCRVLVSGVMGRTAAEESGVACEYCGVPPSMVFAHLTGPSLLLNLREDAGVGNCLGEMWPWRL